MIEEGGGWDRRNRLKVYSGLHLVSIRQFKRGGELFIDALSTFTAVELISYNDFVALTVIANTLSLKRVDLKKKVSDINDSPLTFISICIPNTDHCRPRSDSSTTRTAHPRRPRQKFV